MMKRCFESQARQAVAGLCLAWLLASFTPSVAAAEATGEFTSKVVDIGVVVDDVYKAVKFYTEAVGFKEAPGFSVSAEFCAQAGLTDHHALHIRVLTLGEGESATKLKLMQLDGQRLRKSNNEFIHSQLGFRYLTIMVRDMDQALARLAKAGVKPATKSPVPIPGNPGSALILVKDPDGNIVELVGPAKAK